MLIDVDNLREWLDKQIALYDDILSVTARDAHPSRRLTLTSRKAYSSVKDYLDEEAELINIE